VLDEEAQCLKSDLEFTMEVNGAPLKARMGAAGRG